MPIRYTVKSLHELAEHFEQRGAAADRASASASGMLSKCAARAEARAWRDAAAIIRQTDITKATQWQGGPIFYTAWIDQRCYNVEKSDELDRYLVRCDGVIINGGREFHYARDAMAFAEKYARDLALYFGG